MNYNDLQNFCKILETTTRSMSLPVFEGLIATMVRFWCAANNENDTDILLDILNTLKYIENDNDSLTFLGAESIE